MRTAIIILGGLALLGVCALAGWRFLGGVHAVTAAQILIPVWLAAALISMWIGVARAGIRWPRSCRFSSSYSPFPRRRCSSGGSFRKTLPPVRALRACQLDALDTFGAVGSGARRRHSPAGRLGLINAQLTQPVTAANFLKDVNASGALSVADKDIANANLTQALPHRSSAAATGRLDAVRAAKRCSE
jgi:hypothetical protein